MASAKPRSRAQATEARPKKTGGDARWGGLTPHQQEDAVQMAGKYARRNGEAPSWSELTAMCGFEVDADQAEAAYEEAGARSAKFLQAEIAAAARWPVR